MYTTNFGGGLYELDCKKKTAGQKVTFPYRLICAERTLTLEVNRRERCRLVGVVGSLELE